MIAIENLEIKTSISIAEKLKRLESVVTYYLSIKPTLLAY